MTPAEYVLALISIISGLAICDILASLNRLLRRRKQVRWDWLPIGAAALATFAVIDSWFVSWGLTQQAGYNPHMWSFWIAIGEETLLFLMASAVLPDDLGPEGIDLTAYYWETAPYFWTLFSCGAVAFMLTQALMPLTHPGDWRAKAPELAAMGISALLGASMVFVRSRRWHEAGLVILLVIAFGANFNVQLGG